jgi:hypothetical protein
VKHEPEGGTIMMRTVAVLAASVLAGALATATAAAPQTASLQIQHVVRGCHTWSLNGAPDRIHQVVSLDRGGTILITNDDLMVQDLVKTAGPAVAMKLVRQSHMGTMPTQMRMGGKASPYAMAHMGAQLRVAFPTDGVYRFKLVDRGDYFKNIKTIGPDNKPTLTVTVR